MRLERRLEYETEGRRATPLSAISDLKKSCQRDGNIRMDLEE